MQERNAKLLGPLSRFMERRRASAKPPRFSTLLRLLAAEPGERISIGTLSEAFGDRAFGALMFVFAAPNLIPLPPGASAILGAPLVLITAQLAIGRHTLWLPRFIAERSISTSDFRNMLSRILPRLRWTERLLAPRLTFLLDFPADRLIGIVSFILAIILFLPIPLGNMLPGLAITLFSLGIIQRDGVAAILGWLVSILSIGVIVAISGALWIGFKAFLGALMDLIR